MTTLLRRWAVALAAALAFVPVAARAQGVFDMGGLTNSLSQDVLIQSERARAGQGSASKAGPSRRKGNPKALLYRPSQAVRQRNVRRFVERMRQTDPVAAEEMSRALGKGDYFDQIGRAMRPVGLNPNNLADTMAMYLVSAWYGVRGSIDGKPADFRAVSAQITRALGANPALARASDEVKQGTAESMMLYAVMNEQSVTLAKKNPETLAKVRAAIRQGAQATFGLDLGKMRLGPNGLH